MRFVGSCVLLLSASYLCTHVEDDDAIIASWASQTMTHEERRDWFVRMNSMYDRANHPPGQFFAIPGNYDFVMETYSNEDDYRRISDQSRLIYPPGHSLEEVVHSLIWRVPVNGYSFSLSKFNQVYATNGHGGPDLNALATSYGARDGGNGPMPDYALSTAVDRTFAYGVLSPAKVFRDNPEEDSHWVHVFHTWGVNLEFRGTQDWAKIVGNDAVAFNEESFLEQYRARFDEVVLLIQQAIVETVKSLAGKREVTQLNVRIPGIGLGNFLSGLAWHRPELIPQCRLQFYKALNELFAKSDNEILAGASQAVRERNIRINLTYVAYSRDELPDPTDRPALGSLFHRNQLGLAPMIGPHESVLDYAGPTPEEYYLLINAWDNLSFIGNGGSSDRSLDGYFGGGIRAHAGRGAVRDYTFASTSWVSNLFMIPSLASHGVEAGSVDVDIQQHEARSGDVEIQQHEAGSVDGRAMDESQLSPDNMDALAFLKSMTLTREFRMDWFVYMTSIYDLPTIDKKGQFFAIDGMYKMLQDTYGNDADYARLSDESRLIYPARHSLDEVIHSLIGRVPARPVVFNEAKFNEIYIHNVASRPGPVHPDAEVTYTYGVLSPAKVFRDNQQDSHWVHVFHVPSVDVKYLSDADGSLLVPSPHTDEHVALDEGMLLAQYRARADEMVLLIHQAIVETSEILVIKYPTVTQLNVRIPGMGIEEILSLPNPNLQIKCRNQFYYALAELFHKSDAEILNRASDLVKQRRNFQINLTYVASYAHEIPDPISLFDREQGMPSFIGPSESVFKYPAPTAEQYYLLINDWNHFFFIGNGGARDESLDARLSGGFTTSRKAFSSEPYSFAATCWLSNLFMNPSLVEHGVFVIA